MNNPLITFIDLLTTLLLIAILARVLLSWVRVDPNASWVRVLYQITEPILGPIRRALPSMGGLDLSPLVAFLLIEAARALLLRIL